MAIPGLNSEVLDRIIRELGLQSAVEKLPVDLVPTIQPVLISNPERIVNISRHVSNNATGTATIYATPSDRDFYLTALSFNNVSDVVADNTGIGVGFTMEDGSTQFVKLSKLTTTIFSEVLNETYDPPIKIKKGTNIFISNTFTAGTSTTSANIKGYTVDIL